MSPNTQSNAPSNNEMMEEVIWRSYLALGSGLPRECLNLLQEEPDLNNPISTYLQLIANGLISQRHGDADQASNFFDKAYDIGIPLSVTLRACGRHFMHRKIHAKAYHCYSLLEQLEEGAFLEYWTSLPPLLKCRYAPWVWKPATDNVINVLGTVMAEEDSAMIIACLSGMNSNSIAIVPNIEPSTTDIQSLQLAHEALAMNLPDESLKILRQGKTHITKSARAIRQAAKGVLARRSGDHESAHQHFENVHKLGIPLPALLLECGKYYQSEGNNPARAYECFSLLDRVDSRKSLSYWRTLAPDEKQRYAPIVISRISNAPMPPVYELQIIKRGIVQSWGSFTSSIIYAELLQRKNAWKLSNVKLCSLQGYARENALYFEELISPREVVISAPKIYGGPELPSILGRTRSVFLCVLPDITVASKSNLLFAPGHALLDYQADELSRIPYNADINPLVISVSDERLNVLQSTEPTKRLERGFSLVGNHTYNYGHWIVEFMFQVWACMDKPGFDTLPLIIDAQMPSQLREALEFFVGKNHPIVVLEPGETVHVSQLWTCSKVVYWPGGESFPIVFHDDYQISDIPFLASIIDTLQEKLDALDTENLPQKLYLTRNASQARPFVNRVEVEEYFRQQGFAVLDFSGTPMVEQLRHLRAARTLVVEAGSSLYSAIFCRYGTSIGEIPSYDPTEREWCSELFKARGQRLLLLPCDRTPDGIRADTSVIVEFISQLNSGCSEVFM